MSDNKRVHVLFEGHVQGVGFRYTVVHYSRSFAVTGYVRNVVDGRVELVAEGEKTELESFVNSVANSPLKKHIHNRIDAWHEAQNTFQKFTIAY